MNRPISRRALLRLIAVSSLSAVLPACVPAPLAPTPSPAPTHTASPQPTLPQETATMQPTPIALLPESSRALKELKNLQTVARLVGEGAINDTPGLWGVYGTDLGSLFDKDGRLYMVFGDTFGCCIPGSGGPGSAGDWRSNVMAVITDRDPRDGLTFEEMITDRPGHAKQLLAKGSGDVTVIPTYGVAVDQRMYLHYMAVKVWGAPGRWTLNASGLAYSDDDGHTWVKDEGARWAGDSSFGQAALVKSGDDLYMFGIPGGRYGEVCLARAPQADLLNKSAYRYFSGMRDGAPQWSPEEQTAAPIVPAPVGELSVLWNAYLQRWIMTYLDTPQYALMLREAPDLWGPWSPALTLARGAQYPGLYGAYMHPWLVEEDGRIVYFTMSQWGPYAVFLMKVELEKKA